MDIYLRNVDAKIIRQIDSQVRKLNKSSPTNAKKVSRNEFIKSFIEREANSNFMQFKKDKFDLLVMQQNKLLQENLRAFNRIFWLLTNGDDEQAGDLLDEMANFEDEYGDNKV